MKRRITINTLFILLTICLAAGTGFSGEKEIKGTTQILPLYKATEFIGTEVKNTQGEELGEIINLVVNPNNDSVSFSVLSHGGVLGIGDKLIPVPLSVLSYDTEDSKLVLDITKKQLEAAPNFDPDSWPETVDMVVIEVYKYYGIRPHWMEEPGKEKTMEPKGQESETMPESD